MLYSRRRSSGQRERSNMTSAKERPGQTEEERAYYSIEQRIYSVFAYTYDGAPVPAVTFEKPCVASLLSASF